jgi:hypothetical protein
MPASLIYEVVEDQFVAARVDIVLFLPLRLRFKNGDESIGPAVSVCGVPSIECTMLVNEYASGLAVDVGVSVDDTAGENDESDDQGAYEGWER